MGFAPKISEKAKWRNVLQQQKLTNAQRWLSILETSENLTSLVNEEYDNFLRALETTLQASESFDIAYQLGQILYPITFGYADWDRWLVYLQQMLETSKTLHKEHEEARLLQQIGDIQYHKGNLQDAEENYHTAGLLYRSQENLSDYSRTLAMRGLLKAVHGKAAEGISLCKKALATAEEAKDQLALANAHLNLSSIYRRTRHRDKALSNAQTAYNLFHKLGYASLLTKPSITLIGIWAESGNWEEINKLSTELITILTVSGDVHKLSQLKNNLGVVAYQQGNYNMAEKAWQETLQLHSQIQEPMDLAGIYNNLGMVYTQLKEWETAEEMLFKAIVAYKRFGDVFNWANSLDNLADLYEVQEQTAAFRQTLQEAIDGLQILKETTHGRELLEYMQQRLVAE